MFNPAEWKVGAKKLNGKHEIVYFNLFTGLPKLRATFSREQQVELMRYEARQYMKY